MAKIILVSIIALAASVISEPQATVFYLTPFNGPAYSFTGGTPVVSAALTAPAAVPAIPQYLPVSAYAYGTAVSVQGLNYLNAPAAATLALPSAYPYSAYADYFK